MLYFGPEKSLKSSNLQIVRIFPYSGLRIRSLDEHRTSYQTTKKKSYRHSSFTFDNTFVKMHFTTSTTTRLVVHCSYLYTSTIVLVVIIANRL